MRRRPKAEPPEPRAASDELPSLIDLERFTHSSLGTWARNAERLRSLHAALYNGLEEQRQRHARELVDALRAGVRQDCNFSDWARILDYRYSLTPLSVAGSLKGIGGRFNIGQRVNPGAFPAFPALYVAEDFATAAREKWGRDPSASKTELTPQDLALRTPIRSRSCASADT